MDYNGINNLIINSKVIGKGSYGYVLEKDNYAYKIDRLLYERFSKGEMTESKLRELLKYVRIGVFEIPNIDLLNYYDFVRNNVKYTKLPTGIVYYNEIPLLLQMPYHKGYVTLQNVFTFEYEIYRVLFNLTRAFQELVRNGIYQMDLCYGNNIMVNEITKDVQLIDLDGKFVKYGKDNYAKKLAYSEFYEIVYCWLRDLDIGVDGKYFKGTDFSSMKQMLYHTSKVLKSEGKFYSK